MTVDARIMIRTQGVGSMRIQLVSLGVVTVQARAAAVSNPTNRYATLFNFISRKLLPFGPDGRILVLILRARCFGLELAGCLEPKE
jgi:hypothetical protein